MLAELPMYDLFECRAATDALWNGIARSLTREGVCDVPDRLTRELRDGDTKGRSSALVSQVCGSKMAGAAKREFTYLATPCYSAPGCSGHRYRSLFVVSASSTAATLEDLRGKRCAVNNYSSHSGCNTLRAAFAPLATGGRFFATIMETGGHSQSLALVANGQADLAAIDCITYALLARFRPKSTDATRILAQSDAAPAPPYVGFRIRSEADVERLRAGLLNAMIDPQLEASRGDLFLTGVKVLSAESYGEIAEFTAKSARYGYRDFDLPA